MVILGKLGSRWVLRFCVRFCCASCWVGARLSRGDWGFWRGGVRGICGEGVRACGGHWLRAERDCFYANSPDARIKPQHVWRLRSWCATISPSPCGHWGLSAGCKSVCTWLLFWWAASPLKISSFTCGGAQDPGAWTSPFSKTQCVAALPRNRCRNSRPARR